METSWQCFKKNNNQIATYIQLFLRNCSCESVILYKIEKPNRKTHLKTCLAIVFSFEVSDDPEFTLMHDYWNVCYSPQSLLSMKRQTVPGALWALLCMCLKKKRKGKGSGKKKRLNWQWNEALTSKYWNGTLWVTTSAKAATMQTTISNWA